MRLIKNYWLYILIALSLFVLLAHISIKNNNFQTGSSNSIYFADAAGYYIYLPAIFIYGFEAKYYPQDIDAKMGYGFLIDKQENKLKTKYTIGLALLTLPFFLIFHFLAIVFGYTPDGFSEIYLYMPSIAGAFYLVLGLFLLFKFLRCYVGNFSSFVSVTTIVLGTNLLYFSLVSVYMTHLFSFTMFAALLLLIKKLIDNKFTSFKLIFLLAIVLGFIFLLRPTNIIIACAILFLDVKGLKSFWERLRQLFRFKFIGISLITLVITISPQFLYWKYVSGSFFFYSYGDEGFTNLLSPKIVEVLFAPLNGMFLYNPVIIVLFLILILSVIKRYSNALLFLVISILALYIISSWHCFYYGCGYGCRPFIEYLVLLALPFSQFLDRLKFNMVSRAVLAVCVYLIYFNLSMIFNLFTFTRCTMGELWDKDEYLSGDNSHLRLWNWHEYRNYIDRAYIFPLRGDSYTWKNNFENDFKDYFLNSNTKKVCFENASSGEFVTTTQDGFSDGFYKIPGSKISLFYITSIDISAKILKFKTIKDTRLVCQIDYMDKNYFWHSWSLSNLNISPDSVWLQRHIAFEVPFVAHSEQFSVYFWSPEKDTVYIDDFKVTFRF